jgi:hypothetical protein
MLAPWAGQATELHRTFVGSAAAETDVHSTALAQSVHDLCRPVGGFQGLKTAIRSTSGPI